MYDVDIARLLTDRGTRRGRELWEMTGNLTMAEKDDRRYWIANPQGRQADCLLSRERHDPIRMR